MLLFAVFLSLLCCASTFTPDVCVEPEFYYNTLFWNDDSCSTTHRCYNYDGQYCVPLKGANEPCEWAKLGEWAAVDYRVSWRQWPVEIVREMYNNIMRKTPCRVNEDSYRIQSCDKFLEMHTFLESGGVPIVRTCCDANNIGQVTVVEANLTENGHNSWKFLSTDQCKEAKEKNEVLRFEFNSAMCQNDPDTLPSGVPRVAGQLKWAMTDIVNLKKPHVCAPLRQVWWPPCDENLPEDWYPEFKKTLVNGDLSDTELLEKLDAAVNEIQSTAKRSC